MAKLVSTNNKNKTALGCGAYTIKLVLPNILDRNSLSMSARLNFALIL